MDRNEDHEREEITPQKKYYNTKKGKQALNRYNHTYRRLITNRWLKQESRGTSKLQGRPEEFRQAYGNPIVALSRLNEIERKVIQLFCGLTGFPPMSSHQIASSLHLSVEEVKQIRSRGLRKI